MITSKSFLYAPLGHLDVIGIEINPNEVPAKPPGDDRRSAAANESIQDDAWNGITSIAGTAWFPSDRDGGLKRLIMCCSSFAGAPGILDHPTARGVRSLVRPFSHSVDGTTILVLWVRMPVAVALAFDHAYPRRPALRAAAFLTCTCLDAGLDELLREDCKMSFLIRLRGKRPDGTDVATSSRLPWNTEAGVPAVVQGTTIFGSVPASYIAGRFSSIVLTNRFPVEKVAPVLGHQKNVFMGFCWPVSNRVVADQTITDQKQTASTSISTISRPESTIFLDLGGT